jgi:hypothetical protein
MFITVNYFGECRCRGIIALWIALYQKEESPDDDPPPPPVVKGETVAVGSVSFNVYWEYARAGAGICTMILGIALQVTTQVIFAGNQVLLGRW